MFARGRHAQILNFIDPYDDDIAEFERQGYSIGDTCLIIDYYDNEGDDGDNNVRLQNPNPNGDCYWFLESMLKLIPLTAIRRP